MHIFYTPNLTSEHYTLDEDESKHCIRVLRLRVGDKLILVDGRGGHFTAKIVSDNPKACEVSIIQSKANFEKRSNYIHVAIAPTKNTDRIEWFVEKATEIGIDEISFIDCEHSERSVLKKERIERVAISAMKQSQKAYLPVINELIPLNKFIPTKSENKFIAHCNPTFERTTLSETKSKNTLILIGPEGDFSEKEITELYKQGYKGVSLGDSRLRTETAALVACTLLNFT